MRFKNLISQITCALNSQPHALDEAWDYEYDNLWRHRWGKKPFHFCTPTEQIGILSARTFWYKRLKPHNKNLLKSMLERKLSLTLKEILHVTDGMMSSLLISFPEIFLSDQSRGAYTVADRIMNSLISNGLQDYANLQGLLKSFKKRLRKAAFLQEEVRLNRAEQRKLSWLEFVVKAYNDRRSINSKANMFRVCVFTQTRSTGLANKKMVDKTIDEFIDVVTTKREFEPDHVLLESIDWVLDNIVGSAVGGNPQFRISMSTSSCTENSKSKLGKFGYLKKATDRPKIPKFSPTNTGGQLGNWAFAKAGEKIRSSDPAVFKTNIAGIRENGKCRVVTSGSFYKDAYLQPFSHMTIAAVKTMSCLRNGLSAGRLGYKFIERVDHLDPVSGHVLFEKCKSILSVDWRKATDLPTTKSAHFVTARLLEKMRLPKQVLETVKCIWPGSKDLYLNGKLVGQMVNGIPMGDPLTKSNISLAHPICEAYANRVCPGVKIVHDGNGDDTCIIAASDCYDRNQRWFDAYNKATVQLGYEISEEDHFVTRSWGTYCEEVFHIPVDRFNTVRTASKLKDNMYMPYLDHPKMRLVIDTVKDRADFSSDICGKVTLLGKDMEYAEKGKESGLFSVASASQDVCLGVRYEQRPMYLPRQLYSIGKPPAHWNSDSWVNAIMSQPGKVVNITISSMREMLGELPPNLTEIKSVKSAERHFKNEAIVEVFTIPDDDPIRELIVVPRDKARLVPPGVLDRLVESKHLTTSSEVEALYLFMKRLETLEDVQPVDLFQILRTKVSELREYTRDDVIRVVQKFRSKFISQRWTLRRSFEVDYYMTHHIDELRNSDPRKVDIPGFDYINRFEKRLPPDTPKRRAEEELFSWFNRSVEDILSERQYDLPPTQILEDDPYILQRIAMAGNEVHVIVSDDRKLARLAQNKFVSCVIMRMSIRNWVRIDCMEQPILDALQEDLKVRASIHVDEGSLDAFLYKTDITPARYPCWGDAIVAKEVREQEDIWDVYLSPVRIDTRNVYDFIEIVNSRAATRILGRRHK